MLADIGGEALPGDAADARALTIWMPIMSAA